MVVPMKEKVLRASSMRVMALASRSSSLRPVWDCVAVHFGETTEPTLSIELAAVWVTAQYSVAMLSVHSLSSLLEVRGSSTGRLRADRANFMSATV